MESGRSVVLFIYNKNSNGPDRGAFIYFKSFTNISTQYLNFSNYKASEYKPFNWWNDTLIRPLINSLINP